MSNKWNTNLKLWMKVCSFILVLSLVFGTKVKATEVSEEPTEAIVEDSAEVTAEEATDDPTDEVAGKTGWVEKDGETYYYKNGKPVTGVQKIGKYTYYFEMSGKLVKGPCYKKVTQNNKTYYLYLDKKGRAVKGLKQIPGKDYYYYFYGDGRIAQNALKKISGSYYYFGSSGAMVTDSLKQVKSYYYYFGSDGKAVTGWQTIKGNTYYFNSKCRAVTSQIKKISGYYYYFDDIGRLLIDKYKKVSIKNKTYYVYSNSKGRLKTGLYQVPNASYSYYFNGDGTIVMNAMKDISGDLYFFGSSGAMATNAMKQVDGAYYYFGSTGKAVTGWATVSGNRYYFNSDHKAVTNSIKKVDGYYYYFENSGRVMMDKYKKVVIGKKTYYAYAGTNGRLKKGIFQVPTTDYSYYFNGDGTILYKQFITYNNKLYFLTKEGKVFTGDWRNVGVVDLGGDPLYVHADPETGVISQGKTTFTRASDGAECTYYFDKDAPNGYKTGLIKVGSYYYYFEEKKNVGYLEKGFYTIANSQKTYFFDYTTGRMKQSGTAGIRGTHVSFEVRSNGTLDIMGGCVIKSTDTKVDKLLKYSFSQLFKPSEHIGYSRLMNPALEDVTGYNCSGFVMRMYKEVEGVDIFNKNNDLIQYIVNNSLTITDNQTSAKAGDIVFFNLESCSIIDDEGNPWKIDNDGDGVCDRIHSEIKVGGTRAHVHHVGIYIGNGQIINSILVDGVMVTTLSQQCHDDFQVLGYGRIY